MEMMRMRELQEASGNNVKGLAAQEGKYLTYSLGKEEYGIGILKVREIIGMMPITSVPRTPGFIKGVINLRGKVIPVVGLRQCFGLDGRGSDKHSRIVVVEVNGNTLGFVVDAVSEVLRVPKGTIEPPPQLGKVEREYISGIGKLDSRLLLLLDLDRLMTQAEQMECAGATVQ